MISLENLHLLTFSTVPTSACCTVLITRFTLRSTVVGLRLCHSRRWSIDSGLLHSFRKRPTRGNAGVSTASSCAAASGSACCHSGRVALVGALYRDVDNRRSPELSACSALWARCVRSSFILVILASRSFVMKEPLASEMLNTINTKKKLYPLD
jgi:hypothetical protein